MGKMQKAQWKKLSQRQKLQYFADYYLIKLLMVLGAVFIVSFLLWNYFKPQEVTILKVAVINETLNPDEKQNLQEELLKQLGKSNRNEKVVIDDNYYSRTSGFSKLSILMNAHEIDAVICNRDDFEMLAGEGYYKDAARVLSENQQKKWQTLLVKSAGYLDKKDAKPDYDGTQKGPEKEYGIAISNSSLYRKLGGTLEDPVFSFAVGATNTNNAERLLEKLLP